MKRASIIIGLLIAAGALLLWFSRPGKIEVQGSLHERAEAEFSRAAVDAGLVEVSAPDAARAPSAAPEPEPAPAPAVKLELDTPEHAVESAVRALEVGNDAAFLDTLLPRIRAEASPELIGRCRRRIASTRVLPDWETAENAREDGHDVRRVSMFGKSMTGFHHLGASWLADRIWCVPTGVP